jgi:hypothetical protein
MQSNLVGLSLTSIKPRFDPAQFKVGLTSCSFCDFHFCSGKHANTLLHAREKFYFTVEWEWNEIIAFTTLVREQGHGSLMVKALQKSDELTVPRTGTYSEKALSTFKKYTQYTYSFLTSLTDFWIRPEVQISDLGQTCSDLVRSKIWWVWQIHELMNKSITRGTFCRFFHMRRSCYDNDDSGGSV